MVSASKISSDDLTRRILRWYGRNARVLPWRVAPGARYRPDPYHVWLSEVMLQQTAVAVVRPYFEKFVARWPSLESLSGASLDEILSAWAGLGYYARARNLHACARIVSSELDGRFPSRKNALQRLPGIGSYTAAAIAAIAFGQSETVVDGNVERVMSRLYAVRDPLPNAKKELHSLALALTPQRRPGDYAQAVMDLGATLCTPRKPKCDVCPWRGSCQGYVLGIAEILPRRVRKGRRPTRRGVAFWAMRSDGAVLLRRRSSRGLLASMMEFPSTDWVETGMPEQEHGAPLVANWQALPGVVRHTFTHFYLELTVMVARVNGNFSTDDVTNGIWVKPNKFSIYALPSLMRKVAHHAMAHVATKG